MNGKENKIAKELHRYTHAPVVEMGLILEHAGVSNEKLMNDNEIYTSSCDIFFSSIRICHRRKVSLTQVKDMFNCSRQANFIVAYIKAEWFEVLIIVNTGTKYEGRAIGSTM